MKEQWKDPEYRDKISNVSRERWASRELRNKMSQIKKEQWMDPEYRSNCLIKMREAGIDPERRNKLSNYAKNRWKDPEYRKRMSEMSIEMWAEPGFKESMSGENSATWKGGVSFEPWSPEFNKALKRRIRERDNYVCGLCGKGDARWVHHINYDKQDQDPTNLVTLHNSCHTKTNFDREAWEEFFTLRQFAMIFYSANLT